MKFIADRMLGKLAKMLRILGFDTLYSNRIDFDELLRIAVEEKRIVLTKDTLITKKKGNYRFIFITDNNPERQLEETITNLKLKIKLDKAFTRCLLCNHKLKKIKRDNLEDRVPDYIFETHKDFSYCSKCDKIFWKGTHYKNMLILFKRFINSSPFKDVRP